MTKSSAILFIVLIFAQALAEASPVNFSGGALLKYTYDKDVLGNYGAVYNIKVIKEQEMAGGWSLYARLGAEYTTNLSFVDFNTAAYENKKMAAALDQFGVIYTKDNFTYKLGRQGAIVGATALLYSKGDSNVGRKIFVDGLTLSGTIGSLSLSAVVAKEDMLDTENNIFALHAAYDVNPSLNTGITFGKYLDSTNGNTSHIAIDAAYSVGKSTLTAECTRSSSNTANKAYMASWQYNINDKTAVYMTGFSIETNADMGKKGGFDNDCQGITYGITHTLHKAVNLDISYKKEKVISSGDNKTHFELAVSHVF